MSIGFKEWAIVCDALGRGEQSIILRKGGIAEGRDGFRFKHEEFFLFPTLFHEQVVKTKLPDSTLIPTPEQGMVQIQYAAKVEWTELITDASLIPKLAPFHIWKDEVIEERFRYDDVQGVNLAFIRVFKLEPAWSFPGEPKYGGCRSWLNMPDLPDGTVMKPVIDDAAHTEREKVLRGLIRA